MKRIGFVSLALVLVGASACRYGFPDPKDASRAYACETAKDCTSGFTCLDQVCVDEQKFGTQTVTIRGQVRLGASRVYTTLKGVELGTAVANDGSFTLQVPVGDGHDIVALYSRGPDSLPYLELASILGDTSRLQQLADTGTVTRDDLPGLVLTPFTTAAYGAVVAANGGTLPATRDDLVEAEQNLMYAFTEDQLVDAAAAVFQLSTTSSTTVESTLALVTDPTAMRAFVAQARALVTPPNDVISTSAASLISDTTMTAAFHTATLPPSYFSALKHRHGVIGYADERIVLSGVGSYDVQVYSGGPPPPASPMGWSVDPDGGLTGTLTPPISDDVYMSAIDLASYFPDATTKTSVINAVGGDFVWVQLSCDSIHVRLLASGTGADWVVVTKHGTLGLADALAYYGITTTDQVTTAPPASRLWVRSDALSYSAWPSLPSTTWAMQLLLPSDISYYGDPPGTTTLVTAAYVTFASTGVATATGGVIPRGTGVTLKWAQSADGVLTLTYPDGLHVQKVSLWDAAPPLYGMLTVHEPDASTEYLSYGPTLVADVTAASESAVTNATGEYWQTNLQAAARPPEAADSVPRSDWFGYELRPDHTATRRYMMQSTPGGPYDWYEETYVWRIEGNDVVMELHRAVGEYYSTCTVGGTDPSCYVYRRRRWQPVSMSAARDRLYVIESDSHLTSSRLSWNGSQWMNTTTGAAADLTTFVYSIAPRFNIYNRSTIGQ